jgi:phosphate transport system permease protein
LNAILGSLIMTVLGVAFGAPLGMLAGTYMAEYGRYSKLTFFVRFINDILLSAPSIIIGLFVYEVSSCAWAISPASQVPWRWR